MNHEQVGRLWNRNADTWTRLARAGYDVYRDYLNTPAFFEMLCRMPSVRAIDLGNPEMYDTRRLMEYCQETGTVLHSRLAALPDEGWEAYTRRLGELVRQTGVRHRTSL